MTLNEAAALLALLAALGARRVAEYPARLQGRLDEPARILIRSADAETRGRLRRG